MFIKTHHDFQSIDPYIENAQDIYDNIKKALFYQPIYRRITSPQEMQTWNYEELQRIKIIVEKIDRLYYIAVSYKDKISDYVIIIRMIYKYNQYIYIKLHANFDWTNNKPIGTGEIFVSRSPKLFVTNTFCKNVRKFILKDNNVNPISFIPLPEQHKNFKSCVLYIDNIISIYPEIYGALVYQNKFERKIKDLTNWNYSELQKAEINVKLIDRLYFIYFDRNEKDIIIKFVIRMNYYNKYFIYVDLSAHIDHTKSPFQPNGVITISKDKNLFVNDIERINIKTRILTDNYFILVDYDDIEEEKEKEERIRKRRRRY